MQSFTQLSNGGTALTVTNAAEVTSQGFEADVQWVATDWLRFWGTYGYTDAEFDDFRDCAAGGLDCTGNRPVGAPKNSWNLGTESSIRCSAASSSCRAITRPATSSTRIRTIRPVNLNESSLTLLNGRVGWNSPAGRWSVTAWGRNLTDEATQVWNTRSVPGIPRAELHRSAHVRRDGAVELRQLLLRKMHLPCARGPSMLHS